ncbi:MAG: hypothetical protein RLN62_02330 [Rickettsiales bacterium]
MSGSRPPGGDKGDENRRPEFDFDGLDELIASLPPARGGRNTGPAAGPPKRAPDDRDHKKDSHGRRK